MKAEIKKIAAHYGLMRQSLKTLEELAELGAELRWLANLPSCSASYLEYETQVIKVIEEMADVEVMLEQMKFLLGCEQQVKTIKQFKVNRELERMRNEK